MGMENRLGIEETDSEWMRAHAALSRLAKARAWADAEEGRWLLAARRTAAHVHLGFGSFGEYIERLFGYTHRSTQEKLRVAEALEGLPRLAQALEAGSLSWSALRELTRVAVADTEEEWLELAQGRTIRQLEELVAGKSPGDAPCAPGLSVARRHVLRFEVTPETFALFREASSWLRRQGGDARDDDSLLLSMARHVLGGPADDGRSSYQIALSVCPACGAGQQQASGELVSVSAEVIAMAHCDGQHLGYITSRPANQNAPSPPHATRDVPRTTSSQPDPRHVDPAQLDARQGNTDPPNRRSRDTATGSAAGALDTQSGTAHAGVRHAAGVGAQPASHHVGNAPSKKPPPRSIHSVASTQPAPTAAGVPAAHFPRPEAPSHTRAKQTVPPALRRAVLLRDQHRCQVPGCKNTTFLDVHHIQLRSEGGGNEVGNLITICGCHHRATHRGALLIENDPPLGVTFRHADGTLYGKDLEPHAADVQTKLFSALRHLGFREREVRAVLAELRGDAVIPSASLQDLLRAALRRLRPPQPRP
jgi:hypothetical protein